MINSATERHITMAQINKPKKYGLKTSRNKRDPQPMVLRHQVISDVLCREKGHCFQKGQVS